MYDGNPNRDERPPIRPLRPQSGITPADTQPLIDAARTALMSGDKAAARRLLAPALKTAPSADAWTVAARASETNADAITCLRRALALNAQHSEANRLLLKLEGAVPPAALEIRAAEQAAARRTADDLWAALPPTANPLVTEKKVRPTRKPISGWRYLGCLSGLVLMIAFTLMVLNMVGIVTGVFGTISRLTGGAAPISEWEGVPLRNVEGAAYILPASQVEMAEVRDTDVIDDGFVHEYTFEGRRGQEMGIYVQFLSLGAGRVSRNVAIVRPNGSDGRAACETDRIIEGDSNIVYVCRIDADGLWRVRIVGRAGESVGAYFVGVENFVPGS